MKLFVHNLPILYNFSKRFVSLEYYIVKFSNTIINHENIEFVQEEILMHIYFPYLIDNDIFFYLTVLLDFGLLCIKILLNSLLTNFHQRIFLNIYRKLDNLNENFKCRNKILKFFLEVMKTINKTNNCQIN